MATLDVLGGGRETRRPNPYQASPCQEIDLLRPVGVTTRSVTLVPVAFSFSAVFVSSAGSVAMPRDPTPIEALASQGEVRES